MIPHVVELSDESVLGKFYGIGKRFGPELSRDRGENAGDINIITVDSHSTTAITAPASRLAGPLECAVAGVQL